MEGTETPPHLSSPLGHSSGHPCVQCKESGDLVLILTLSLVSSMTLGKSHRFAGSVSPSVKTTLRKPVMLNKCLNN